jgi:multiple sugar transport system permease protein
MTRPEERSEVAMSKPKDVAKRHRIILTRRRFRFVVGEVAAYLVLIAGSLLALSPLFIIALTSLKSRVDAFTFPPVWIFTPRFDAYVTLFTSKNMGAYLWNSVVISVCATALSMLLGVAAAYAMARFHFPAKDNIAFWILSTRMMPPIARVIPIFLLAQNLRLLDTHVSLILLYTTMQLPFVVWMMWGFFKEIPKEAEEAAMVDGDPWYQAIRKVTLPLAAPAIVATAIFVVILSWNEFAFALILTSRDARTLPASVLTFLQEGSILWHEVGAAAVIISVPIILFASLVQKHLVRGLTMGMLKG